METHRDFTPVLGADQSRPIDCLFINAPLRDYAIRPRVNDYTLPVLGMAYIATYAADQDFNVGILDAEAHGMPITEVVRTINKLSPRWAGFNLLAPTFEMSAQIVDRLDPAIMVMAGGHHAKAMPTEILADPRMRRCEALVLGEAETRVAELLIDHRNRADLPGVMWTDPILKQPVTGGHPGSARHLAPDIDALPFVDRAYLAQDPYPAAGRIEANVVGARGCPYDCSFCGAAVSANPDIAIRTRRPDQILREMETLRDAYGVTAFRFVDDLFLGARRVIEQMMTAFAIAGIGDWAVWDATGRINVLHRANDATLDLLAANGLREVALGIESGNERMLTYIDKRITPDMVRSVVTRLTARGICVKGYFILGFPTETRAELNDTVRLVHDLWEITDTRPVGDHRSPTRRLPGFGVRVPPLPWHSRMVPPDRDWPIHHRPASRLHRHRSHRPGRGRVDAPTRRVQLLGRPSVRRTNARRDPSAPGRSVPRTACPNREARMTTTGCLVTIDGPGCAGKSTLTRLVVDRLAQVGLPALATTEPSKGPAGRLARQQSAVLRGYALACLVTADRYHHLETEIHPALDAGIVVVCDRYVPSSHVLQVLDGVDPDFVTQINASARPPDLAVILACDEAELRRRLTIRGSHGRFEDDPRITLAETHLYRDVANLLTRDGIPVLLLDSAKHDADFLARLVVTSIQTLRSPTHQ